MAVPNGWSRGVSVLRMHSPCLPLRTGCTALPRSFASTASHEHTHTRDAGQGTSRFNWAALGAFAVAGAGLLAHHVIASEPVDYDAVRKDIEALLEDEDYDDGSFGPILVRLAWHASGTFNIFDGTGGSNGATMRFNPEAHDGANAGLDVARHRLEPIKRKYPGITYADLWTLAACVAIEFMGGPVVPWQPGRLDKKDGSHCPPVGRLPDAAKAEDHIRAVFYRMGLSDREIVALIGAHCLGRCHTNRSGYEGPWTHAPTTFSNEFFEELLHNKWTERKWKGPVQFENAPSKELVMLPTDMALLHDKEFRKWVEAFANDEKLFFKEFAAAFAKLLALGVAKK
eukprot:TRINITY_DN13675_c0_g1_i1.p1 TRINITY_DN13675_c0_g1~~TRINITY_DN13675_c0_g1_i1.p1  ORF type:complete len:366 (+),score=76.71 TRINITY_DN13675_c0_g1_i1:73-1098(+)